MVATTNSEVIGLYNLLHKQELFIATWPKTALFQVFHSLASYLQDRVNEGRGFIRMSQYCSCQSMAFGACGALATEPTFVDKACLGPSLQYYTISGS